MCFFGWESLLNMTQHFFSSLGMMFITSTKGTYILHPVFTLTVFFACNQQAIRISTEGLTYVLACWVSPQTHLSGGLLSLKHGWIEMGVSKKGVPQNGWFIMENLIKMDNLGGKPTSLGNTKMDHHSILTLQDMFNSPQWKNRTYRTCQQIRTNSQIPTTNLPWTAGKQ